MKNKQEINERKEEKSGPRRSGKNESETMELDSMCSHFSSERNSSMGHPVEMSSVLESRMHLLRSRRSRL